jgi:hypothetical protein
MAGGEEEHAFAVGISSEKQIRQAYNDYYYKLRP